MRFYSKIVWRYFRSRKGFLSVVSGFSLTGIILGVAALIVVMSVMAGFREELLSRILGVSGHASISMPAFTLEKGRSVQTTLANEEGIETAIPYVFGQGMILHNGAARGAIIRSLDMSTRKNIIFDNIASGDIEELTKPNRVAVGVMMAKNMGIGIGSVLTVLSPQGSYTVAGFIPRMKKVKVAALFDLGMQSYDSSWLYMNIPSAQKLYGLGNNITGVDIRVDTPDNIEFYQNKMLDILPRTTFISTWKDNNRQFFDALQVERVAMFVILTLIVIVATFNIITGQTMTVNDKRGDIAILRSMGAKQKDILWIFFLNGTLIGVIGTALGVSAGLLVVNYLQAIVSVIESMFGVALFSGGAYFLEELPAKIIKSDIYGIMALSLSLSMLASLYPAWRAAAMDPVEVLRSE